jgi:hypothetical protein
MSRFEPNIYFCECEDWQCVLQISIPEEKYNELHKLGRFIISSKCPIGVHPKEVSFVSCESGYTVYAPVKLK